MRKLLNPGDLRHRVAIQEQVAGAQDADTGAVPYTWQTVNDERGNWSSLPAQKLPLSAREFEAAAATQAETSTRFVMRWRSGVVPKMRLVCLGIAYNINGVIEDQDSGRDYMTLSCSAGVNSG